MSLEKNQVYTDVKYGCDLVIEEIGETVVLIEEIDSGNNHLYAIEQFLNDNRFVKKQ